MKAGRLLEEMLQNLCAGLSIAVPFRLRGDYTLDPLWTSLLPKAKKNAAFYAAVQVHLEKSDELRRLRNLAGAHDHQWAALLTGNESKELSDAIVAVRECVYCPDCHQFVSPTSATGAAGRLGEGIVLGFGRGQEPRSPRHRRRCRWLWAG